MAKIFFSRSFTEGQEEYYNAILQLKSVTSEHMVCQKNILSGKCFTRFQVQYKLVELSLRDRRLDRSLCNT